MSLTDNNLTEHITHTGVIRRIDLSTRIVSVALDESRNECPSCPAAVICSAAKSSNIMEIAAANAAIFHTGQRVKITATEQMHKRAITLLTFLPCIALIATMVAVFLIWHNELAAVLSGIGMTIAFFILLFIFRNRIAKDYNFIITPTQ